MWSDERNRVQARVLRDSMSPLGHRLVTAEVTMHRFVLAEFNTHRRFSRNSASSRAIPVIKQINKVRQYPAIPLSFPSEQKGMQGGEEIDGYLRTNMEERWREAAVDAAVRAEVFALGGLHKSVVNRILEPYMWHNVIVSSTDWANFFEQRCSPLAQPEMRAAAEALRDAIAASEPDYLEYGDWHTPLIHDEDHDPIWDAATSLVDDWGSDGEDGYPTSEINAKAVELRKRVSVARCARSSYLTHDGIRDITEDLALYEKLVSADPPHWSPLEHVATPCQGHAPLPSGGIRIVPLEDLGHQGNFDGWDQLRHMTGAQ